MDSSTSLRALALCLLLAACDGGTAATLAPLDPVSGRVNEELSIDIAIDNPSAQAVTLTLEGPMLPSFDRVTSLSTSPTGGTFTWVPLSSHVGEHELTFVLSASGGGELDRETVLVTVEPAADAAPVFVRPGAGGTYDLTSSPCVMFDVEVRDDDSDAVEIGTRADPPQGATLANAGNKRATFDWCPTPDQVASSERWTIQLFADDGDHPAVEHDYVVVLRSGPPRDDCPGSAPTVTLRSPLMSERVTSGSTYPVQVTVSDDMGLRDAPLLYYTTTEPEDPSNIDVTQLELATFTDDGGGSFTARIPSLGLAEGEEAEVFYLVSATDNDDPSGSLCDHRTDTMLVSFTAVGGARPDGSLPECEPCSASTECMSGICAATAGGGRCVDSCSGDGVCDMGDCGATVTTEGGTRAGCGPAGDICGGGGPGTCTDDSREDDDTVGTATAYSSAIGDGQICAGDDDYFGISVPTGNRVTVTVDGFAHADGDLDLQLRNMAGTILGSSASVRDVESVSYCNGGGATSVYARVYGYGTSQNSYSFRADVAPDPGSCCTDDGFEPDDTQATARSITFASDVGSFDGVVCASDDDWIAIPMSGPGRIQVLVTFTHALGDIDIQLYDPSGTRVASSLGTTDDETIDVMVSGGTHALRVYAYGDGNPDGYLGEITRTIGTGCSSTSDCLVGLVCDGGSCASDACASSADCPAMHSCPTWGPSGAARHCAESCTFNADCRAGEACKWFVEGRGCGPTGGGSNGASCASASDCGGQRTCVAWSGGYCARAACTSNANCETGTWCVSEGGVNVCALSCVSLPCREAEGYTCDFRPTIGGTDRFVCVPR